MSDLQTRIVNERSSAFAINPLFLNRWSPRAFDQSSVPLNELLTIIEAARWAPSAFNIQPWRFIYINRDDARWDDYINLLDPFNASWGQHAGGLIFVASDQFADVPGMDEPQPAGYHQFDTGAACAQAALQAADMGYALHTVAGLYKDKAKETFQLPERLTVQVAMLIGKIAPKEILPGELQERETPSQRKSIQEIAFNGGYNND